MEKRKHDFWRSFALTVVFVFLLCFVTASPSFAVSEEVNITGISSSVLSSLQTRIETAITNSVKTLLTSFFGTKPSSVVVSTYSGTSSIGASNLFNFFGSLVGTVNTSVKSAVTDLNKSIVSVDSSVKSVAAALGGTLEVSDSLSHTNLKSIADKLSGTLSVRVSNPSSGGGMTFEEFDSWYTRVDGLKEQFRDYFYLHDSFDQYLGADGEIHTEVRTSGMSDNFYLTTLLSNGLRGLRENIVGFKDVNHNDLLLVRSYLSSFKSANHTDLTSGFATNHDDLSSLNVRLNAFSSAFDTWSTQFYDGVQMWEAVDLWNSSNAASSKSTFFHYTGMLSTLLGSMQNDLAKLRYVLASDQDIEIAKKQEPVKDSIENNFVGDAPAAVKPADIDDMAGFSGELQGALSTGANAGDVFSFIGGSAGVGFWSQAVASDLDNVPAVASEDDEDYIHFYDPSIISSYLSGGG